MYAPEKVMVESVAERLARLEPRAIPEMVEFWSWLLPMVVVPTTAPLAETESSVLERPVIAKVEVVALVVVD